MCFAWRSTYFHLTNQTDTLCSCQFLKISWFFGCRRHSKKIGRCGVVCLKSCCQTRTPMNDASLICTFTGFHISHSANTQRHSRCQLVTNHSTAISSNIISLASSAASTKRCRVNKRVKKSKSISSETSLLRHKRRAPTGSQVKQRQLRFQFAN